MVTSSEPSPAATQGRAVASQQRLVFVTGAGRSGTSSVSGSLKYLGLHVPQPEVAANKTNPRGFFESRWVVDFHKRLLDRAGVATMDGSPEAVARVRSVLADDEVESEMRTWLTEVMQQSQQIVIKDPRTLWAAPTWERLAREMGAVPSYVTMMRHPAEVVGSRATYYSKQTDEAKVRQAQVRNLGGWVNVNLINEELTRGHDRVFVPYNDLIADWRAAMGVVGRELDLEFNADLDSGEPHEIDSFIDADLRRVRNTWDDLDAPDSLQDIAAGIWDAIGALSGDANADREAREQLDELRSRYAALHDDSVAIAGSHLLHLVASKRGKKGGKGRSGAGAKKAAGARGQAAARPANRSRAGRSAPPPSTPRRIARRVRRSVLRSR